MDRAVIGMMPFGDIPSGNTTLAVAVAVADATFTDVS